MYPAPMVISKLRASSFELRARRASRTSARDSNAVARARVEVWMERDKYLFIGKFLTRGIQCFFNGSRMVRVIIKNESALRRFALILEAPPRTLEIEKRLICVGFLQVRERGARRRFGGACIHRVEFSEKL